VISFSDFGSACDQAIRSVTHLVLAPGAGSLFIKSFPSFRRPSRFSGTRKHSVPDHVHSVFKNCGSSECLQRPTRSWLVARSNRLQNHSPSVSL